MLVLVSCMKLPVVRVPTLAGGFAVKWRRLEHVSQTIGAYSPGSWHRAAVGLEVRTVPDHFTVQPSQAPGDSTEQLAVIDRPLVVLWRYEVLWWSNVSVEI